MNDTPSEMESRYRKMLLAESPARRLSMACRMFSTAKALALAGARRQRGEPRGIREVLFLRLYGREFSQADTLRILDHLRTV